MPSPIFDRSATMLSLLLAHNLVGLPTLSSYCTIGRVAKTLGGTPWQKVPPHCLCSSQSPASTASAAPLSVPQWRVLANGSPSPAPHIRPGSSLLPRPDAVSHL